MPVVSSQYWNSTHGFDPEEVAQDLEGLQTMRTLARNMAYLLKRSISRRFPSGKGRGYIHEFYQVTVTAYILTRGNRPSDSRGDNSRRESLSSAYPSSGVSLGVSLTRVPVRGALSPEPVRKRRFRDRIRRCWEGLALCGVSRSVLILLRTSGN